MASISNRLQLTILGGSSVSTPVLLLAIQRAVLDKRLPPMCIRLWGRSEARMKGICEYADAEAAHLQYRKREYDVTYHTSLEDAVARASHILCQLRPGGMQSRAWDERAVLSAGIPADEGIGPGGLAAFLRGRSTMCSVLRTCVQLSPGAVFLQLSGPLGLMTALAREHYPASSYGVCELPITVSGRVLAELGSRIPGGPFTHALTGVNHCSWLHAFIDAEGVDRTAEFVSAIEDRDLVQVSPSIIREYGAIPLPYLRLIFHPSNELRKQTSRATTRGEELAEWVRQLDSVYCRRGGVCVGEARELLRQRRINWYDEGVIPILAAFLSDREATLPLNLPNDGTASGLPERAVIETHCQIGGGRAMALATPGLPALPRQLTRRFVEYEQRALSLEDDPTIDDVRFVLAAHPLVPPSALDAMATFCTVAATA